MEIKKIKVHTCNQKVEGNIQDKCRCRKFVTLERAAELIDNGAAANIITACKIIEVKEPCPICAGLQIKKSCTLCGKTGEISNRRLYYEYGEDIYMRPFLKTPRTATIEEEHIEYAYIKGDRDAIRRIDLYHSLTISELAKLGAAIINSRTREILFNGSPEPEDDPKKQVGRRYDWGRSPFCTVNLVGNPKQGDGRQTRLTMGSEHQ